MGIKIKLMMGYGLDNVQKDDPRINFETSALNYNFEDAFQIGKFSDYIQTKEDKDGDLELFKIYFKETKYETDVIHQHIIYDDEFGLENVLLFVPLTQFGWIRKDNTIDYYLHNTGCFTNVNPNDGPQSWYKIVPTNFYPYNCLWMDKNYELPKQIINRVILETYKRDILEWTDPWKKLTECNSLEELYKTYTPFIPKDCIEMIKFSKIFHNEETILELKPMIYSYWS
jgi:hypothetical protein